MENKFFQMEYVAMENIQNKIQEKNAFKGKTETVKCSFICLLHRLSRKCQLNKNTTFQLIGI